MDIGNEVVWQEGVRQTGSYKQYRITKGVVVGKRTSGTRTEFEIAVRWYSGCLPRHPKAFIWVPAQTILFGLTDERMVSVRITPMAVAKRLAKKQVNEQALPTVSRKAA